MAVRDGGGEARRGNNSEGNGKMWRGDRPSRPGKALGVIVRDVRGGSEIARGF